MGSKMNLDGQETEKKTEKEQHRLEKGGGVQWES